MNSSDVIKAAMKEDNLTQLGLAKKLGYETQSYVGNPLNRKSDMKAGMLVKMAKAMGYDIAMRRGDREYLIAE